MFFQDLAKECKCDVSSARKWAKATGRRIFPQRAANNIMAQAMSDEDCALFKEWWANRRTVPEGLVVMRQLAKECGVDIATVVTWAKKNAINIEKRQLTTGPLSYLMDKNAADEFKKIYHDYRNAVPVSYLIKKYKSNWKTPVSWAEREGKVFIKLKTKNRIQRGLLPGDAAQLEEYLKKARDNGFFYFVQPIPEYNPNRVKLGFTSCLEGRMEEHKCMCPNAVIVRYWSCLRKTEKTAIKEIIRSVPCTELTGELFECDNFEELLHSADAYFERLSVN
jgi:hypothetical protein